jgi:hypothetical protein
VHTGGIGNVFNRRGGLRSARHGHEQQAGRLGAAVGTAPRDRGVRPFGGLLNRRRSYGRGMSGTIGKRVVPELTNKGPAAERIIRGAPREGGTRPAAVQAVPTPSE